MAYELQDFEDDGRKTARTLHAAYRRAQYLLDRWNSGVSAQVSNADVVAFMARCSEMVTNLEANDNAKLLNILRYSDLKLPGD